MPHHIRINILAFAGAAALCLFVSPLAASAATAPGTLIKLSCPAKADVNDPCKAVYLAGGDGKRHAFPNEHVYFSWYANFNGIQTLSSGALSAFPLGENVTYRPGVRLVKFVSVPNVYAVALGGSLRWIKSETAALTLYGANWSKQVDDIPDTFYPDYRFGADISASTDFDLAGEQAAAPTPDANLASTSEQKQITTSRGTFNVQVIKLQRDRFSMITDTAEATDCTDHCLAKPLADYAKADNAIAAIHGTYFCPPDYADCAGKINTFLSPVFNSNARLMRNASSLAVHEGPIMAQTDDGSYFFFHRTKEFGQTVHDFEASHHAILTAAIANYPSLIENGTIVVTSETRLAETNPTSHSTRAGLGYDAHFVYLVVASPANVEDLASIMQTLGATNALNLDGGGSTALWYDGSYVAGPGRMLTNAVLFKKK